MNDITEIQWIFELSFFQTSNLTFIASEIKILFLQWLNRMTLIGPYGKLMNI